MSSNIAIHLEQVSKYYKLYNSPKDRFKEALDPFRRPRHKRFFALNHIDLKIRKGEILGVVGRNGSGKSTLLKLIAGVIPPSSGQLTINGNVSILLELGSGLNPELTGIQNIYFGGIMLGYPPEEMETKIEEIVAFADIGDFINQPLKTYSSGMKARLGFALAISINPDILVLDEVLSVGDELFRRKCHVRMRELFDAGKTILYVAHNVASINELCSRAIILDRGEIIMEGPTKFVTSNYQRLIFAKKDKLEATRREIIDLNTNEELKLAVYEAILKDEKEKNIVINRKVNDEVEDSAKIFIEPSVETVQKAQEIVKLKPQFIPQFTPLTTNAMINSDIDIFGFSLNTMMGEKVNSLVRGEYYTFLYNIIFNEPIEKLSYGLGIRSEKGLPLTWRIYPGGGLFESKNILAGETCVLKWKFKCLFYPGNYYISITLRTGYQNQEIKVNKIDDVFVFKVAQEVVGRGGYFDSDIECEKI